MNTLQLYAPPSIASVSFLIFNSSGTLIYTVVASKNASDVWVATVPPALPLGPYSVVGVSAGVPLGSESIIWDGSNIYSACGLSPNQTAQLNDLYLLMGLDGTKPLIVSPTRRMVDDGSEIDQSIQNSNGVVTVTRVT